MKDIFKKLNNNQGASFIIALIFFLVAMLVAGLIIASSVTNSSRIQNRDEDEQAYLSASSTAQLIKEDLASMKCVLTKENNGAWTLSEASDSSFFLSEYVNQYVADICTGAYGSDNPEPEIYKFTFGQSTYKPEDTTLKAVALIRGGEAGDEDSYTIDCLIEGKCGDSKHYITLTATASKIDETNKIVEHDTVKNDGSYGDKTTTEKKRTITWSGCTISKGVSGRMKSQIALFSTN